MATDQHDVPASVSSLAARVESWARELPDEESAVLRQILQAAAGADPEDDVSGFGFGAMFGPLIIAAYEAETLASNVQKKEAAIKQALADKVRG
jgi:hypothetical protein